MAQNNTKLKITSALAKTDDGTLQLTFTVPFEIVKSTRDEVITELAKNIDVPGFRKGKAPKEKAAEKIPQDKLIQETLSKLLPHALAEAIKGHKIIPAIYPKFELIKADENEDWQVRALTCEMPKVDLGNYKEALKNAGKTDAIWKPGDNKEKTEPTKEQKEELVIKTLLETAKVNIPQVLLEEEVNARLSNLLHRIEHLGLNLESYLTSVGKTPESLREEYNKQSEGTLKLDLILGKIIEEEKISVNEEQIDEALKASSADPNLAKNAQSDEQKRVVRRVLTKRAALDSLVALL